MSDNYYADQAAEYRTERDALRERCVGLEAALRDLVTFDGAIPMEVGLAGKYGAVWNRARALLATQTGEECTLCGGSGEKLDTMPASARREDGTYEHFTIPTHRYPCPGCDGTGTGKYPRQEAQS